MSGSTKTEGRFGALLGLVLMSLVVAAGPAAAQEDEHAGCVVVDSASAETDTGTLFACPQSASVHDGGTFGAGGGGDDGGGGTGASGGLPTRIDAGAGGVALLAQIDCPTGGGAAGSSAGDATYDSGTADVDTGSEGFGDSEFTTTSHTEVEEGVAPPPDTADAEPCTVPLQGGGGNEDDLPNRIEAGAGGAAAATTMAPAWTTLAAGMGAVAIAMRRRH